MKKIVLIFVLCLSVLLCSCSSISGEPPSVNDIDNYVDEHYETIMELNNYFKKSDYRDILISYNSNFFNFNCVNNNGTVDMMMADFEDIKIEDQSVKNNVNSLLKSGCRYISYTVNSNTIIYDMWSDNDKNIGFVFTVDDDRKTEMDLYIIEIEPLSKNNCYYYVEDYNEWRRMGRPEYKINN